MRGRRRHDLPTAKVSYASVTAAFKDAAALRKRRKQRGAKEPHGSVGVEVYRCVHCAQWHLGRSSGNKPQPRRQRNA